MTREDQNMRSELVREAILNTALEIGIQEGFEALTVRKITNKMKYSTGVVYHHFTDKQEIIDAVEAKVSQWLRGEITALEDQSKTIVSNMEAVFHRIMLLAFMEPEKYNLIVLHMYSRRNPAKPAWLPHLSQMLKQGMEDGLIRKMEADQAAFCIWSSFIGFNLMISRHRDMTREYAEELFRVQFETVFKGVLACG